MELVESKDALMVTWSLFRHAHYITRPTCLDFLQNLDHKLILPVDDAKNDVRNFYIDASSLLNYILPENQKMPVQNVFWMRDSQKKSKMNGRPSS